MRDRPTPVVPARTVRGQTDKMTAQLLPKLETELVNLRNYGYPKEDVIALVEKAYKNI